MLFNIDDNANASIRLFQSVMMGIRNDEVMQIDSEGAKLYVCYANSFIQQLSNPHKIY